MSLALDVSVSEFSARDAGSLSVSDALELTLSGRLHVDERTLVHVFLQDHRLTDKQETNTAFGIYIVFIR